MELYIDLQKRFIRNFDGDMETARNAFEAYWKTLEHCAREAYSQLCIKYNGSADHKGQGILYPDTVWDFVKGYFHCPNQFATEVCRVMTLPKSSYHEFITEIQGGGVVV